MPIFSTTFRFPIKARSKLKLFINVHLRSYQISIRGIYFPNKKNCATLLLPLSVINIRIHTLMVSVHLLLDTENLFCLHLCEIYYSIHYDIKEDHTKICTILALSGLIYQSYNYSRVLSNYTYSITQPNRSIMFCNTCYSVLKLRDPSRFIGILAE